MRCDDCRQRLAAATTRRLSARLHVSMRAAGRRDTRLLVHRILDSTLSIVQQRCVCFVAQLVARRRRLQLSSIQSTTPTASSSQTSISTRHRKTRPQSVGTPSYCPMSRFELRQLGSLAARLLDCPTLALFSGRDLLFLRAAQLLPESAQIRAVAERQAARRPSAQRRRLFSVRATQRERIEKAAANCAVRRGRRLDVQRLAAI